MANFCGKCGKPLQDGETCTCSLGSEQQQGQPSTNVEVGATPAQSDAQNGVMNQSMYAQVNQTSAQQPDQNAYQQTFNQQPNQGQPGQGQSTNGSQSQFSQQASQAAAVAGDYAKNIWKVLLDMWKAPADHLSKFVDEKNFNHALGFIGAEAILSILFTCLLLRKAYTWIMSLVGNFSYLFADEIKVPYFKTALYTLLGVIICAGIFTGITMLVVKQFGKVNKSFKEAVCVYATKSAASLPFLAVGAVLSILNLALGVIALAIGGILGYYYVHTALNDGSIQDENKRVYTSFLIFALNFIATVLVMYLYIKIQ